MTLKVWMLAAISLGACASRAPEQPRAPSDYAIELRRPSHKGERLHVVTTATFDESRTTSTEQVLVKKEERHLRLHLDADLDVLEVDPLGDVTREDLTVASFTEGPREIVARGGHIMIQLAAKKNDSVVEIDGKNATAAEREMIDMVTAISHGAGDQNTVLGTRVRQPVGGVWAFDKDAMRAELARTGVTTEANALDGHVALASVDRIDGVDCLDVRMDFSLSAFTPEKPLPEGSTITRSKVTARVDEHLPIDAHAERKGDDLVVHAEFEAFVPVKGNVEVAGVTFESRTDHTRHTHYF